MFKQLQGRAMNVWVKKWIEMAVGGGSVFTQYSHPKRLKPDTCMRYWTRMIEPCVKNDRSRLEVEEYQDYNSITGIRKYRRKLLYMNLTAHTDEARNWTNFSLADGGGNNYVCQAWQPSFLECPRSSPHLTKNHYRRCENLCPSCFIFQELSQIRLNPALKIT